MSRQAIVQDVALLRAKNKAVMSTNKGYVLSGQISVDLVINNRLDAVEFAEQMARSKDLPLKVLTSNCHYHTIAADSEKNPDMIEKELRKKGYLGENS